MTENDLVDKAAALPGWFRTPKGFIRCVVEGENRPLCPLEAVARVEKLDDMLDLEDIGARVGLLPSQASLVCDAADMPVADLLGYDGEVPSAGEYYDGQVRPLRDYMLKKLRVPRNAAE